jgi:hypothetical protein
LETEARAQKEWHPSGERSHEHIWHDSSMTVLRAACTRFFTVRRDIFNNLRSACARPSNTTTLSTRP